MILYRKFQVGGSVTKWSEQGRKHSPKIKTYQELNESDMGKKYFAYTDSLYREEDWAENQFRSFKAFTINDPNGERVEKKLQGIYAAWRNIENKFPDFFRRRDRISNK